MDSTAKESETPPAWRPRLEMIECYAVRMNLPPNLFDPDRETAELGGNIMGDLAIRFHDPQAGDDFWKQSKVTPGAEAVDDDGFSYIRTPVEHVGFMHLAKRDALTYVFSDNLDRLRKMAEYAASSPNGEAAAPWTALDGGLATVYSGAQAAQIGVQILASIYHTQLNAFDEGVGVGLTILYNDVQSLGFGIDVDPETEEIKLRMKAKCKNAAAAQRVRDAVAMLQRFAIEQVVDMVQGLRDPARVASLTDDDHAMIDAHRCWTRLLADAQVETQPAEDGLPTVAIESAARLPQAFLTAYLSDATSNESTK